MSDPWTQDDTGKEVSDGTVFRYNRASHILSAAFLDGTSFKYDATAHVYQWLFKDGTIFKYDATSNVWTQTFKDGAIFQYDASQGTYLAQLPTGASYTINANGATIQIAVDGTINIDSPTQIVLAGGGPPVARIGDTVVVNDPDDGPITGYITSGSSKVNSG